MSRPVVLDNTVLSNFARVGRADLVIRLWPKAVCTTSAVVSQGLLSLDEGNRVLDLMIERNYHSPVQNLEHLL